MTGFSVKSFWLFIISYSSEDGIMRISILLWQFQALEVKDLLRKQFKSRNNLLANMGDEV